MAARPIDLTSQAIVRPYTVQAAGTVTKGLGVVFGTAETECLNAGANGKSFGVALESGTAADVVQVALEGIVPVLVGTGGATAGEFAVMAADGFTNQTLGGGTTVKYIEGVFLQTGVAGDYVGMKISKFAAGAA
jgi:hypothetical protein